jgi:mannose-6-phosphate isomerase-like protein (cupin superfamily)
MKDHKQEFVLSRRSADDTWHEGRAGMQYRDLLPGGLGGRLIASHIRIPDGGETKDYVHYHKVRFQMIYFKEGWVRVVYEDQGAPFVLQAGDCVLQPPEIRHRVLESSPGAEVIEIASPAIYETYADHEMQLPTPRILPERLYGNQPFVLNRAGETFWTPWIVGGFESRDLGITAATNDMVSARVVRTTQNSMLVNTTPHESDIKRLSESLVMFVLNGQLALDTFEKGNYQLQEGECCVVPAIVEYTLSASAGFEMLEVRL